MLKNYLLTAFREIFKNKIFSAIHIVGLAMGFAAFVHILQYSLYELSYDKFYDNQQQIYRIRQDRYDKGKLSTTWGAGCSAIGPALKNKFPEVESYARLANINGIVKIIGKNLKENNFREERMFAVNTAFLTMFPLKLIAGVDTTALNEPFTAVISESLAKKYFGDESAMGQTFYFNKDNLFTITGVFRDIPQNTHLKYDMLISWPTYVKWRGPEIETAWFWDGFYTYVQLKKGTDVAAFEKKMGEFADRQIEELTQQKDRIAIYTLQPLSSIHLNSNLMWEAEVNGDSKTVYFLMVIACIILIIAWVNYINLSTVKAIFRSREVAMRKISGASRAHLVRQFLVESFTINLMATFLAYIFVLISMPFLRKITGREMSLNTPEIWTVFAAMIVVGPIVSGIYPALVISSFKPIAIFRGKLTGASGGAFIRKALVVFQFAASITLIAGTFTVYNQLLYMRSQELGVNIDQTLIIKGPGVTDSTYEDKLTAFKEELLKYPMIKAISASTSIPGSRVLWNAGGIKRVSEDDSKSNQYRIIGIDDDFVDAYKLNVIAGRGFSKDFGTDRHSVLFNEEALKLMNFESPDSALGVDIYFWGENYKIVGVLKNFHQESLKEKFDAIIFRFTPDTHDYFSIKLNYEGKSGTDIHKLTQNTIETIKTQWEEFFPGNPFDYFFLSDHYDQQYKAENQFRTIFGLFAILAIIIACMGLFGLSWFIIVQRTKEIGIRKVNGASVSDILLIVSKDFFRLVLYGIIIAAPVTYYLSMRWMEKYPFKVGFNWWLFALSGILILFISAITISYNTLAIAHSNPAESINYE
jgi:putative ABC transport system permease protein